MNYLHSQCKKCMLPAMSTLAPRTDGRAARAERTRDAVVDAMLSLVDEGELRPTARQISARANVSLRSVFQHFEDMETLFAAAADRQLQRVMHLAARISTSAPFEERLAQFVGERERLYEAITPVRRAALLSEPFSTEVARRLKWTRDQNHSELERVFAPELSALPKRERADTTAALHASTEWSAWETLRSHDQLSPADASRVMSLTIRSLLRRDSR